MWAPVFYGRLGRICALVLMWAVHSNCLATGVTIITHGYNANVNGWISGMAGRIPLYSRFPGSNFTTYTITLTTDGNNNYFYQWQRTNSAPATTDSGEIIVKLDWSQMAGGSGNYNISTIDVATIASYVLLQTNAIADLGGHALAELPIHLIGHSRGGSLVSEIAHRVATNGVWVDHLTTLDPHPLNNDGFTDPFTPNVTDASVKTFANVLFHDNYWENSDIYPVGETVAGSYSRFLPSLSGGYSLTHSDIHLWYHGTIDWRVPAGDTEASITAAERNSWWVAYEQKGTNAGFEYTLIGNSNRLSNNQPLGLGTPAIRDGYNQMWDLGAGNANNRTALGTNNGTWASLIKFNRLETSQVVQGQSIPLKFYYQWARPTNSNATVSIYLDDDPNVLNNNQRLLLQMNVPGTTMTNVNAVTVSVPLFATNATPGLHWLLAVINNGGQIRYLYSPELVQVIGNPAPVLDIAQIGAGQFRIGVNGQTNQTIVLESSSNFSSWQPLATNTLTASRWNYTNSPASGTSMLFYRARLPN
jgi:hypothetical protein